MADDRSAQQEFSLDALGEEVGSIREFVEQQSRRDEVQQKAFDALYTELKQYKEDFIYQQEKPLLLDLLLFYDSLNWFQQSLVKQEMSAEVIADSFQYLIDEFLELLYRRDVVPMEGRERFDRETQKAIKVVYDADPAADYAVRQVLKRGFSRGSRILRPEEVVISRFDAGRTAGDDPDNT
ncbi:nucleotide exchange factor GrpE [Myxococcota bacterium]|nr:nucleotide exchange factor GrpE [Myxococcota bacterium]